MRQETEGVKLFADDAPFAEIIFQDLGGVVAKIRARTLFIVAFRPRFGYGRGIGMDARQKFAADDTAVFLFKAPRQFLHDRVLIAFFFRRGAPAS